MNIKSEKSTINAPVVEVFNFLANAENIGALLPEGEVKEFEGDERQCSFKVQAGVTISLVQKEIVKNEKIVMESGEKSPFPFELVILMEERGDQTEGYIDFEGEVNAFLKMMVQKPLTNLFNHMTQALKEKYD
ncbi:MAG: SRPBCC domain-containing protein [Bacteroidota bacterium]